MKKMMAALMALALGAGAAFGGSTSIVLTPPVVTSWTVGGNTYTTGSDANGYLANLNSSIATSFTTVQNTLNNDYFSKLHDLTNLARGFANANTASFDNASLLGYQTYDLFAAMIGFNVGAAVPAFNPSDAIRAINTLDESGDVYAGMGTGGFAGQVGMNLSFLIPNLYVTGKLGFVPAIPFSLYSYQQGMIGVGANYTIVPQYDFLFGFLKWRGLSVGSGFTYNGNAVTGELPVSVPSVSTAYSAGGNSGNVTATATNAKAKVSVNSSSLVIPFDIMTSVQVLWFINFGVGAGLDMSFSGSKVSIGGDSQLDISGVSGHIDSMTPGSAVINSSDTNSGGDLFVPRIAASLGLDISIVKIDIPMSYYPTTKAFAFGVTTGVVW